MSKFFFTFVLRTFFFFYILFQALELSQVLKPDDIIPILANADIQKHLMEYLPEGEMLPRTEEELRNTVKSPQFQQVPCRCCFFFFVVFTRNWVLNMNWSYGIYIWTLKYMASLRKTDQKMFSFYCEFFFFNGNSFVICRLFNHLVLLSDLEN